jgi:CubicO group peptidase (beta-lactamase class C family)
MRRLLDHSSGFPNWRWLADDKKLRIYFTPGSRCAYSGEGIDLAQTVVETVTKKSIDELMRERIFQSLGMTRTSRISEERFEDNHADRYDEQEKSLGPEFRQRGDAAGSMQTTLRDYARFVQAVLSGTILDHQGSRVDAKRSDSDYLQARIPLALHRDDNRKSGDPSQLWPWLGTLLDAVRQSLLQGRT